MEAARFATGSQRLTAALGHDIRPLDSQPDLTLKGAIGDHAFTTLTSGATWRLHLMLPRASSPSRTVQVELHVHPNLHLWRRHTLWHSQFYTLTLEAGSTVLDLRRSMVGTAVDSEEEAMCANLYGTLREKAFESGDSATGPTPIQLLQDQNQLPIENFQAHRGIPSFSVVGFLPQCNMPPRQSSGSSTEHHGTIAGEAEACTARRVQEDPALAEPNLEAAQAAVLPEGPQVGADGSASQRPTAGAESAGTGGPCAAEPQNYALVPWVAEANVAAEAARAAEAKAVADAKAADDKAAAADKATAEEARAAEAERAVAEAHVQPVDVLERSNRSRTGFAGVSQLNGKFIARVHVGPRQDRTIGANFTTAEEAAKARALYLQQAPNA